LASVEDETTPPEITAEAVETPMPMATPVLEPLIELPDAESAPRFPEPRLRIQRSFAGLAVRMMLLIALLAVGVVFHRPVGNAIVWLGLRIAGTSAPEISPVSQNEPTVPATSASESPVPVAESEHNETPAATNKTAVENAGAPDNTFTLPAKNPSPASPAAVLPVTHPTTPPPTGVTGVEPGQLEFLAAQDILKKNTDAGMPEAVRLLWAAVEKGNPNAEVALAELYRDGRGVAKNCDQTKILLTAAARRGSSQAQKLLDQFEGESCE